MIPKNLNGKKVILRVDFNVPFSKGKILDDFRIRTELPMIVDLLKRGAQLFLITHMEQDGAVPHLDFLATYLQKRLKTQVCFIKGEVPSLPMHCAERVVLFDNIRLNNGEKSNNIAFAKRIACWGDYYIDDAFSAMHRKHASIVGVPRFLPADFGLVVKKEIAALSKVFHPRHPFLFVLGGKKFETKEPLIGKFLKTADNIFLCGALANAFLAQRGNNVGKSEIDTTKIPKSVLWHKKIILPSDVVVVRAEKKAVVSLDDVTSGDIIVDVGPKTVAQLSNMTHSVKFILWNGSLGICEKGFADGTKNFAKAVGKSKAYSIVGGGDTVAAVRKMKLEKNFDFISTGGGAMLDFLAKGTLPGIDAIKDQK